MPSKLLSKGAARPSARPLCLRARWLWTENALGLHLDGKDKTYFSQVASNISEQNQTFKTLGTWTKTQIAHQRGQTSNLGL